MRSQLAEQDIAEDGPDLAGRGAVAAIGLRGFRQPSVRQIAVEELPLRHRPSRWSFGKKFVLFDLGFPLGQGEFSLALGGADCFPFVLALAELKKRQEKG